MKKRLIIAFWSVLFIATAHWGVTVASQTTNRVDKAEGGYSRAVRVETLLKSMTDAAGQPIEYPRSGKAQITGLSVEIPVGEETGWHIHPCPCVAYVVQGEVTVEVEKRSKQTFKAGDCFAEVVNLRHCGHNTGTVPVKILMFVFGEEGVPVSKRVPK